MENNKLRRKRKLYKMVMNEDSGGVNAISLVLTPAIMREFVALSKNPPKRVNLQEDKRILVSPVLIPDLEIPRMDEESGEEYDIIFGKEEIAKIAENFLINGNQNESTLEHGEEIDGVSVIESWIKESENDKSKDFGFGDLPTGTWFVKIRIHDEELWNKIKSGEVRGLSIEGLFGHELVENAMVKMRAQNNEVKAQNVLNAIRDIINEDIDEELGAEVLLSMMKGVIKNDNRFRKTNGKKLELESYTDYPDGVVNNARKAIEWTDKNGWGSCGTPVGKIRATQLAGKKPISVDTIKRMRAYLIRHEVDLEKSKSFSDGCGYLMYMSWGGKAGLVWATKKLKDLGLLELSNEQIYGKRYINLYETEPYFTNNYTTPAMDKPTYFDLGLEDACWDGYVAIGTKMLDGREVPNCVPEAKLEALAKAIMELGDVELDTAVGIASSYAGQFGNGKKQTSEADILRKRNKDGKLMEVENGADMVNPMNNKPYQYPSQQEQTEATTRYKSF